MAYGHSGSVRCAVIGYGGAFNMGRAHAEQMNAAGMTTVAACDVDPERMAQAADDFPGIRTYTKIADLLQDDDVDLCVVILPHNLHAPVAIQCAEAGKHVVVEKPMSVTVAEADAMIEAARANGRMLSVFHNRRWDGDFMTIRELIGEGLIGEVFKIEAAMGGYSAPRAWWRSDKAIAGGVLHDWGAHILDWIFHLVPGPMAGVDGYFHKRVWTQKTLEDHGELTIRFAGGETATVEISSIAAATKPRWRILGTKGALTMTGWDTIDARVEHAGRIASMSIPARESRWPAYYENVAQHLTRGAELIVKPEEARRVIAAIEAGERSSAEGRTVVPDHD